MLAKMGCNCSSCAKLSFMDGYTIIASAVFTKNVVPADVLPAAFIESDDSSIMYSETSMESGEKDNTSSGAPPIKNIGVVLS